MLHFLQDIKQRPFLAFGNVWVGQQAFDTGNGQIIKLVLRKTSFTGGRCIRLLACHGVQFMSIS